MKSSKISSCDAFGVRPFRALASAEEVEATVLEGDPVAEPPVTVDEGDCVGAGMEFVGSIYEGRLVGELSLLRG